MGNQSSTLSTVLIVLVLLLCGYFIYPKGQEAYDVYKDIEQKSKNLESLKAEVSDLKIKKEQSAQAEKSNSKPIYKNDVEVNDRMSSFGVMFEDVIQSAKYNGLKLRSIEYNDSPADDVIQASLASDYNVCAIKMQLIGSYMQFRSYFQDIYNYPFVLNLDKIAIKPYEKNKKVLIANVEVTLYSAKTQAQKAEYAAANAAQDDPANPAPANPAVPAP